MRGHVNFTPVNKKLETRSTFTFSLGLSYIASISFTHVKLTGNNQTQTVHSTEDGIDVYQACACSLKTSRDRA